MVKILKRDEFKKQEKKMIKRYFSSFEKHMKKFKKKLPDISDRKRLKGGIYKARIGTTKGKSSGLRILYKQIQTEKFTKIILMYVYDKKDYENVSEAFLDELIQAALSLEIEEDNISTELD